MRKYLVLYEKALSDMTLQPIPSEFSYIWGKFYFIFISVKYTLETVVCRYIYLLQTIEEKHS